VTRPADRRLLVRGTLVVLAAGAAAVGVGVLAAVPPTEASYYPRCSFHQLTGLHCPGCGTTRALHAGLNGDFARAAAYNLLAPVLLPLVGVSLARSLWAWVTDARPGPVARRPRLWWAVGGLMVGYTVLRNLPAYPFTLLAPHDLGRP
jgi:hypothetical protein